MTTSALGNILDFMLDTVFVVSEHGVILSVFGACKAMLGYDPSELAGERMMDFVAPEDREKTIAAAQLVAGGQSHLHFENRYIHRDGRLIDLMWSAKWCETDRVRVGVARDISARKRAEATRGAIHAIAEATLRESEQAALAERIGELALSIIPGHERFFILESPDCSSVNVYGKTEASVERAESLLAQARLARSEGEGAMVLPGADNARELALSWLAIPIGARCSQGVALVGRHSTDGAFGESDIAMGDELGSHIAIAFERCAMMERLKRAAHQDGLTGLANQGVLRERLAQALDGAREDEAALLFLDLDEFKKVNDTLGHECGDQVLLEFARRLALATGRGALAARLGGDEFAVLVEGEGSGERAVAIRLALEAAMAQPIQARVARVVIRPSVGLARYPFDGRDPDALLRAADASMYAAKAAQGRGSGLRIEKRAGE